MIPASTGRDLTRRAALAALATAGVAGRSGLGQAAAPDGAAKSTASHASFDVPPGACDGHHHIYDVRFPYAPGARLAPPPATVTDYRALQRRLGTTRSVVVNPSAYATDNTCLLDALAQFGPAARGIAVVAPSVSDAQLKILDAGGVRGLRVLYGRGLDWSPGDIEGLARRIEPIGWHMEFYMPSARVPDLADMFLRLPVPIVFDHMGHVPQPEGMGSGAYRTVRQLLDTGRTWVKLSGAYMDTKLGPPEFTDTSAVARGYIAAVPERVVWGSNWPHPAAQSGETPVPDNVMLLDLLATWAPDPAVRHRILVENPERLFGFDPTARPAPASDRP